MRKGYFLLIITIIGLSFSSCKKEAAKATPKTFDISGKWKLTALNTDFIYGDRVVGTEANQSISSYVDHMEFLNNGTGIMSSNGKVVREFKYDVTDSKIHFSSVFYHSGQTLVSERSFMSLITNFTDNNLQFTDQIFVFTQEVYKGEKYDQYKRHITLVKVN